MCGRLLGPSTAIETCLVPEQAPRRRVWRMARCGLRGDPTRSLLYLPFTQSRSIQRTVRYTVQDSTFSFYSSFSVSDASLRLRGHSAQTDTVKSPYIHTT